MDVLGPFSTLYEKMVLIRLETPKTKIFLPDPSIRTISELIFGEKLAFPQNGHFQPNSSQIFGIGQNGPEMGRKQVGNVRDMIFYQKTFIPDHFQTFARKSVPQKCKILAATSVNNIQMINREHLNSLTSFPKAYLMMFMVKIIE